MVEGRGVSRRDVLKRGAALGVVWATPAVQGVAMLRDVAQATSGEVASCAVTSGEIFEAACFTSNELGVLSHGVQVLGRFSWEADGCGPGINLAYHPRHSLQRVTASTSLPLDSPMNGTVVRVGAWTYGSSVPPPAPGTMVEFFVDLVLHTGTNPSSPPPPYGFGDGEVVSGQRFTQQVIIPEGCDPAA